jgi:Tfp pilus assembly ATPase PilU
MSSRSMGHYSIVLRKLETKIPTIREMNAAG